MSTSTTNKSNKCEIWSCLDQIANQISKWVKKITDQLDENIHNASPYFIKPKYDVVQFDDSYYIRIEISDIDKNSLYTTLIKNRGVCVYMKKNRPTVVTPHEIVYSNRTYGMCKLYILFPNSIKETEIYPTYYNGILTLKLYKKEISFQNNYSTTHHIHMDYLNPDYHYNDNDNGSTLIDDNDNDGSDDSSDDSSNDSFDNGNRINEIIVNLDSENSPPLDGEKLLNSPDNYNYNNDESFDIYIDDR